MARQASLSIYWVLNSNSQSLTYTSNGELSNEMPCEPAGSNLMFLVLHGGYIDREIYIGDEVHLLDQQYQKAQAMTVIQTSHETNSTGNCTLSGNLADLVKTTT